MKRYDRKMIGDRIETSTILSYLLRRNTTLGPIADPLVAILSDLPPPFFPSPRYYSLYSIAHWQLRDKPIRAWAAMVQPNHIYIISTSTFLGQQEAWREFILMLHSCPYSTYIYIGIMLILK